jgi:O-methyltransferase/8-demethyl-8-(2,3-dimethoxy-alpha-L-rhamnosyl)tetracenomycin-C 4'-O-methyltransferase
MALPTAPDPQEHDRVSVHEQVVTQPSESGLVVLAMDSFTYLELDAVGASMWQALAATGSFQGSLAVLEQEYAVDRGQLADDLATFIERLREAGLVKNREGACPVAAGPQERSSDATVAACQAARERYLDLLIRALCGRTVPASRRRLERRALGQDPSEDPALLSWIGLVRLRNVKDLAERVLTEGVPGDLIECGVGRGGAAILMKGVLSAHKVRDRRVWLAGSFAGLPPPHADLSPWDARWVRHTFEAYGLLDDSVGFLPGWFADSQPGAPIRELALLRLDGDLHESSLDALIHLYPKLSVGGFVIVEDYCLDSCRQAVDDYRREMGIEAELNPIDWNGVWWRKSAGGGGEE